MEVISIKDKKRIDQLSSQIAEIIEKMSQPGYIESDDDKKQISELELAKLTSSIEYNLTSPIPFEVLSCSMAAGTSKTGFGRAEAGKVVFDALYLNNQEPLDELQKPVNAKLYFGLCLRAYDLVDFEDAELKKK